MNHSKYVSKYSIKGFVLTLSILFLFGFFGFTTHADLFSASGEVWQAQAKKEIDGWHKSHKLPKYPTDKQKREYFNFLEDLSRKLKNTYPQSTQSISVDFDCGIWESYTPEGGYEYLCRYYMEETGPGMRLTIGLPYDAAKTAQLQQRFKEWYDVRDILFQLNWKQPEAMRLVLADMEKTNGKPLENRDQFNEAVDLLENRKKQWMLELEIGNISSLKNVKRTLKTIDGFLLKNPLVENLSMIYLRRELEGARKKYPEQMGFPSLNSHTHTNIWESDADWYNQIMVMDRLTEGRNEKLVYRPEKPVLVTDLEIDFDAGKILFSSIGTYNRWQIFELGADGKSVRPVQLTPADLPDINHFDACYLPDGNIVYTADAAYQGLPCENGSRPMALIYLLDRKTGKIRQLTFEQDSDWCPTVLNNGRVMYLRWEYSDISHYFSRILMSMNPDGTGQMEYYGSNSYFPNSFFYARAIPDEPTKVVGVVGGHHGISRSGRLMILDPEKGRREADGVVQEIPHRGEKVQPIVKDMLVNGVYPQFLHPYPINDKYYLVSAKLAPEGLWGLYLVDVFNNMTLIKEEEGAAFFDPILLKKQPVPPIIPSRVDESNRYANVFLTDIYEGEGLKGIPHGTVKKLRLFSYYFAHMSAGGHNTVGIESSWDVKRILGTVDVEADGSAFFTVPANTPISIQPLDSAGRAIQLMRSWFVGMPGENVSCVGCHEQQSTVTPNKLTIASRRKPEPIKQWQGNPRPFAFRYEVQPLLDRKCLACHNGENTSIPDFRKKDKITYTGSANNAKPFLEEKGYLNIHPYVFRPGPESDNYVIVPMEYHSSVSELIQMLQRGHHNVKLDKDEWEKLYTWIDLNAPYRGKWDPPVYRDFDQDARRKELLQRYAGITIDPEAEFDSVAHIFEGKAIAPVFPDAETKSPSQKPTLTGFPFSPSEAKARQNKEGITEKVIDLGAGKKITLVRIPAGEYISGGESGYNDEREKRIITVNKPFWMASCEVSNKIYNLFDPKHDSRFIDEHGKDHNSGGFVASDPEQPAIRLSQVEAEAFCRWLSQKSGLSCALPTEEQWEWACRAGSDSDFWFGNVDADFSAYENMADQTLRFVATTWNGAGNPLRYIGDSNPSLKYYDFIPRSRTVDDGELVTSDVSQYQPNPWGLHNMHGNVAEWTSTHYKTGINRFADQYYSSDMVVVKGGSFRDRPKRSTASVKRYYLPYQKPFNVGFRFVVNE